MFQYGEFFRTKRFFLSLLELITASSHVSKTSAVKGKNRLTLNVFPCHYYSLHIIYDDNMCSPLKCSCITGYLCLHWLYIINLLRRGYIQSSLYKKLPLRYSTKAILTYMRSSSLMPRYQSF